MLKHILKKGTHYGGSVSAWSQDFTKRGGRVYLMSVVTGVVPYAMLLVFLCVNLKLLLVCQMKVKVKVK